MVLGLTVAVFAADDRLYKQHPQQRIQRSSGLEAAIGRAAKADRGAPADPAGSEETDRQRDRNACNSGDPSRTGCGPCRSCKIRPATWRAFAPIVPPLPAAPAPNAPFPPRRRRSAKDSTQRHSLMQLRLCSLRSAIRPFTPIGFMDLTNTYRSTNAGTSLQTNFGSIPYNNGVTGRLSEDKLSAANSRIGFRTDANCERLECPGLLRRRLRGRHRRHRVQHPGIQQQFAASAFANTT